jgi:hypothetical protein
VSRATARAMSTLEAEFAARRRGTRPAAGQAVCGPHCTGMFSAVVGPCKAERVLCAPAELGFGPEAV